MRARTRSSSLVTFAAAGAALALVGAAGCGDAGPASDPGAARGLEMGAPLTGDPPGYGGGGPAAAVSAEYQFPATIDPEVQGDRYTELWARVYRPEQLDPLRPHPLLVFLHGNHATCGHGENPRIDNDRTYTFSGTCPPGYVVAPSHAGYEYAATELAALGYVVVSINANRGINAAPGVPGDAGLNLARGRLILKHLALLSRWNRGLEATPASLGVNLAGRLDFANVGLMGHSRGGEGARAAYNQYRDPDSLWPLRIADPVTIRGIFEIGPVDGQSARTLDASGARWTVLLPMCDGDVSNLSGVRPFDRMMRAAGEQPPRFKATFTVWGTNHNYFNTEWQLSDSSGCTGHLPLFTEGPGVIGSAPQRETARVALTSFFRAAVGTQRQPDQAQLFNPLYPLPRSLTRITRIERGYTVSSDPRVSVLLEDFAKPTGTGRSGLPTTTSEVIVAHQALPEHDSSHRGARLTWTAAGGGTFFQTNLTEAGSGLPLSRFGTLDLRVDRAPSPANPPEPTSFSVQLVHADGTLSGPVAIARFVKLIGPVGGPANRLHMMLQTARIPLGEFPGAQLDAVQAVRLTFDRTATGSVLIADLRASGSSAPASQVAGNGDTDPDPDPLPTVVEGVVNEPDPVPLPTASATPIAPRLVAGNTVRGIGPTAVAGVIEGIQPSWLDVELESPVPFAEQAELLLLQIGDTEVELSRHPETGSDQRLVFTLTPEQTASLQDGDDITVRYGGPHSPLVWTFGPLDASLLPP